MRAQLYVSMNRLTTTFLLLLISCALPLVIHAQIVLNEVSPRSSPEWVELYNLGPDPVDLTGWYFLDKQGNKKIISAPEPVLPGTFYVFSGINSWLNNEEEESLALFDLNHAPIDSVAFAPTAAGTSVARQPDFTGTWLLNQALTQGGANLPATPSATPTPTPSPSPSLSPSYSPAMAQLPSPSVTPTPPPPSPTPSPSPTPLSPSLQPSLTPLEIGTVAGTSDSLDLSTYGVPPSQSPTPSPTPIPSSPRLNVGRVRFVLLTGSGLILLAVSLALAYPRLHKTPPLEL